VGRPPVAATLQALQCAFPWPGRRDARDFTALGDTVNTAARLSALAGRGEILISCEAGEVAGIETGGLERRTLEIRGRDQKVDVWVPRVQPIRS
jgi:class 3 adenylate cyclase